MNQQEMIIKYMADFGSITPMEAFAELGVTRLSAKIYILKREGYVFDEKKGNGCKQIREKSIIQEILDKGETKK